MKLYYNEITETIMTEEEFIADCQEYIRSLGDNGGESLPTLQEVMINTDFVYGIKEELL